MLQLSGNNYVVTGPIGGLGTADGWIKTRLKMGDELATLAPMYGMSAQQIVEGNDISFNTDAINAWVLATGGTTLSNGQPVFSDNTVIFLPPGGPRPPAEGGGGLQTAGLDGTAVALGLGAVALLGLGAVAYNRRKKRGRKNPRRKSRRRQ